MIIGCRCGWRAKVWAAGGDALLFRSKWLWTIEPVQHPWGEKSVSGSQSVIDTLFQRLLIHSLAQLSTGKSGLQSSDELLVWIRCIYLCVCVNAGLKSDGGEREVGWGSRWEPWKVRLKAWMWIEDYGTEWDRKYVHSHSLSLSLFIPITFGNYSCHHCEPIWWPDRIEPILTGIE